MYLPLFCSCSFKRLSHSHIPSGSDHEEHALVPNVYFVTQWDIKKTVSQSCDKVCAHLQYVCSPAGNTVCTGKKVFAEVYICYSGSLYWFVHTASDFIHHSHTAIDPSGGSCGHLCGSGYAEGPRETQQRRRQLLVSPECWEARWLPDWFSGPLPILHHHLYLSVSEVYSRGLIFWTHASQILLRWALVTRVLEVWFMNRNHQEYSFWQQKQIMEETE